MPPTARPPSRKGVARHPGPGTLLLLGACALWLAAWGRSQREGARLHASSGEPGFSPSIAVVNDSPMNTEGERGTPAARGSAGRRAICRARRLAPPPSAGLPTSRHVPPQSPWESPGRCTVWASGERV